MGIVEMNRQLQIFIACYMALRDCRVHNKLSKKHFIKVAIEYGINSKITKEEIEKMLETPLKMLLKDETIDMV